VIRDIAAHHQSGEPPLIDFVQLAPASRSIPPAPLFLLGPANAVVTAELFAQIETGQVGCYRLHGATIAPTGIAIKDGVAFSSTAFIHPPHHVATVTGRLRRENLPVRRIADPVAVIYGPGHETYGHWLVDFLPRLWVLAASGHDLSALHFIVPPDITPVGRDMLALAGIDPAQLITYRYWREVLQADTLLMPTGLRTHNRMSPLFAEATRFWLARLPASPPRAPVAKLFVSRAGAGGARILVNRDRIEAMAQDAGFTLVHPETLTLRDQVSLLSGAEIICGEYGSALHGAVYAGAGTITCGLRGNLRHPSFIQSGLAAALHQQVGYVLGATEGEFAQRFTIDPENFRLALELLATTFKKEGLLS
jgi:capsular polysaccharide biosynthesis protein